MVIFQQAPFLDRVNLSELFSERGYRKGIEIGTHQGVFASEILSRWIGDLYCVDPWDLPNPKYDSQVVTLAGSKSREEDFAIAKRTLSAFGNRADLIKGFSVPTADLFKDSSLDFVYIDGDHRREAVEEDLRAWWPKIRSEGIIAGHDIVCPRERIESTWATNTQPAVLNFAEEVSVKEIFLIVETLCLPWSFYLEKP